MATIERKTKETMNWEEIKEILSAGKAREFFGDAGSISIEVEGIGAAIFDIIGYDSENLADKDSKHSMTLWMRDLLFDEMAFNEEGSNKWENSSLRKYINSEAFIERFEPGFRELLSPVYKKNDDRAATKDTFFLLSKEELEGGYGFFKTERDRVKVNKKGETDWYWTRSAFRGCAYGTWYVYASGSVHGTTASWAYRFSPACVISAQRNLAIVPRRAGAQKEGRT